MSASYGETLRDAAERLASVSETPRLDAELLLAHALGLSRTALLTRLCDTGPTDTFEPLLARRMAHEPVAYILGHREFYSLDFIVRPPVLIPRPETEHLVEAGLAFAKEAAGPRRILDLCTGSGCVAVTLAHELSTCDVTAVDILPAAAALARENSQRCGVSLRVLEGDLFDSLPGDDPPYDLVTANPPYVETGEWDTLALDITEYEDRAALLSGEDGLDCIRRIVRGGPNHLRNGGMLAMELGEKQHDAVAAIMKDVGFADMRTICDLAGIRRIICGRWNGREAAL